LLCGFVRGGGGWQCVWTRRAALTCVCFCPSPSTARHHRQPGAASDPWSPFFAIEVCDDDGDAVCAQEALLIFARKAQRAARSVRRASTCFAVASLDTCPLYTQRALITPKTTL
jgi:hypothetical protein